MLRDMSRLVAGHFHIAELGFKMKDNDSDLETLPVWAVNDLDDYISYIHDNRKVNYGTTTILLGTDMGQKFLKFTLQVIDNAELEGTASNVKHKTTGVNKLHYFALCDSRVPENHHNVGLVFVCICLFGNVISIDLTRLYGHHNKRELDAIGKFILNRT